MKNKMIYRPLTATPFKRNVTYNEIEPCQALRPYVRCFWGGDYDCLSNTGTDESSEIVIPDTCVDIIYRMDDVGNIIISDFCGKFEISMEFLEVLCIFEKSVGVDGEIEFRCKK